MKALREKWNSSRGASILLALLFLLICMMVGASVLMAASSNAGKIRSNREEQQRYLTLSSALTLICGELEGVEYRGRYQYERIEHHHEESYADGSTYTWTNYEHLYRQEEGSVRAAGAGYLAVNEWALKKVFPLVNDLDALFAGNFRLPAGKKDPLDLYPEPTPLTVPLPRSPHTLTLTANGDAAWGGLLETVEITAEVRGSGGIVLTASLKEHPEYIMEAVLKPGGKPDQLLVPDSHSANGTYETQPVGWTLEHIVKKEAADEEIS